MTATTLTDEDRTKITALLDGMHLPVGIGTKEEACSIAAITSRSPGRSPTASRSA